MRYAMLNFEDVDQASTTLIFRVLACANKILVIRSELKGAKMVCKPKPSEQVAALSNFANLDGLLFVV